MNEDDQPSKRIKIEDDQPSKRIKIDHQEPALASFGFIADYDVTPSALKAILDEILPIANRTRQGKKRANKESRLAEGVASIGRPKVAAPGGQRIGEDSFSFE